MRQVRDRIDRGGERVWRLADFQDLPFWAVAQALSRLARDGSIDRLVQGVYYPGERRRRKKKPGLRSRRKLMFPTRLAAASLLGFTRRLVGNETAERPESWARLSQDDAALLDFLRHGGRFSDFGSQETIRRTLTLLREPGKWDRLVKVADSEPPRVRAILGAFGPYLGADRSKLQNLRATLNSHSRYQFGLFAALPNATMWWAKKFSK